jgi:hypothetical protein
LNQRERGLERGKVKELRGSEKCSKVRLMDKRVWNKVRTGEENIKIKINTIQIKQKNKKLR